MGPKGGIHLYVLLVLLIYLAISALYVVPNAKYIDEIAEEASKSGGAVSKTVTYLVIIIALPIIELEEFIERLVKRK